MRRGDGDIYSVKVLDDNNESPVSRVIEGIYWCIENDMDIVQMSFGMETSSEALKQAVDDAYDAGILMIASAGNTGGTVTYPAAYDHVMAVGAVDSGASVSEFSASGDKVDLYAPGEQVCVGSLFDGMLIVEGTSISAAQVCGAASIIKAVYPDYSPDYISGLLKASGQASSDPDKKIADIQFAVEYGKTYIPDEETDDGAEDLSLNQEQAESYDVDYVVGQWSKANHESLVRENKGLNAADMNVLVKAVKYPDEKLDTKTVDGYFHAGRGTNYIANLRYLYKIAALMEKGNSYADAVATLTDTRGVNGTLVKRVREEMLTSTICNADTNSRHHKALKVLGVALHLGGDTFAHMTLVTETQMQGKLKNAPQAAIDAFNKNELYTGRLKDFKNTNNVIIYPTDKFEDNVTFMPARFEIGTRRLNQMMMEAFESKSASFKSTWLLPETDHNYKYKLYAFETYRAALQ